MTTEKTIAEWMKEWLEVYAICQKESTYNYYNETVRRILKWKPEFNERAVYDITEEEVQEFINVMADVYAKSTLNGFRVVFHQAFEKAAKNNLCRTEQNPIGKLIVPKWASVKKVNALTIEQQRKIEDAANNDILGDFVLFFLRTGLRATEFMNLKWSDYSKFYGDIRIKESKSKAGIRTIPLLDDAWILLESQPHLSEYIFTSTIKCQVTKCVLRKLYLRMREATGIPEITNHVYRHTFATRLVENGVKYNALAALLGHKNVAFTMHQYVDEHDEFLREQISLLNQKRLVPKPRVIHTA